MELVIQKATELGVLRIVFITTPRCVVKLNQQDFMQLDLVKDKSAYNMFTSIQNSKNRR